MKFSDLVEESVSGTEKREHLADGDVIAISFHIPRNLKGAVGDEARNLGVGFPAFVRPCLIQGLSKGGN